MQIVFYRKNIKTFFEIFERYFNYFFIRNATKNKIALIIYNFTGSIFTVEISYINVNHLSCGIVVDFKIGRLFFVFFLQSFCIHKKYNSVVFVSKVIHLLPHR